MTAYVVVDVEVHDHERYEEYKQLAPASIAKHGGKYVARGGKVEVLEGSWKPRRFVILEFPSLAQAKKWWDSPDYADAKRLRQQTASTNMVVIEGLP
jgi:uncharacterized protein (DUF1330 family)